MTYESAEDAGGPSPPRWSAISLGLFVATVLFGLTGLIAAIAVVAFRPGSNMRRLFMDPAIGITEPTHWPQYPEFVAGHDVGCPAVH